MDGSSGFDALSAVQSRIADIQARMNTFNAGMTAPGGRLGAPDTTTPPSAATSTDASSAFAAALSAATNDVAAAGSAAGDATTDATGVIPADGDMRSPAARDRFARDLLARIGAPVTAENVRALVAWQAGEGTRAAFNPLATVRSSHQAGESQFNSVGVKNFPTYKAGLDTTVAALENGLYGPVLAALQRGDSAEAVAKAVAASRWGTGNAILRALH